MLNVYRQFAIPAFTPVLLNLSIIGAALFLAPYCDPPIKALAWGVFIGGAAQLALQIRPLAQIGMLPRPRFDWRDQGVRRVLRAMGPAVLGVSAAQISALINTQLAAALGRRAHLVDHLRRPADGISDRAAGRRAGHGAAAVARQASRRRQSAANTRRCSTGACGSRSCSRCRRRSRCGSSRCRSCRRCTSTAASPSDDVLQTRAALLGYSVGLLGLILVKILAPGFYARQNMRTPVKIAFVTVLVAQTLARDPDGPSSATPGSRCRRRSARASTPSCCSGTCASTASTCRSPAGWRFLAKLAVRAVRAGACCSPRSPVRRRSGWRAGCGRKIGRLAVRDRAPAWLAYFGALWLLGFRLARLQPRRDATGLTFASAVVACGGAGSAA